MKRLCLVFAALLMIPLAGASCKKKENPPVPPPQQGKMPVMPESPQGPMGGGLEKNVVISEEIQAAWKAVKIEVEFKEKKSKKAFTIPLNSEFKVPDSDLVLKIGAFLPHFTMTADQITSLSSEQVNPACDIEILVGEKQSFEGWLFAKFPDVHPFQHDKYGVKLVEGLMK
ncbi:MAG: DUF2155 domain-containing protein [Deltaproteobacteria bacterium]|nr:DUF2155 domain-containing protein [Deltaproteobacteria bacterium]